EVRAYVYRNSDGTLDNSKLNIYVAGYQQNRLNSNKWALSLEGYHLQPNGAPCRNCAQSQQALDWTQFTGGAFVFTVDISDPNNAITTFTDAKYQPASWVYDADRASPSSKTSSTPGWTYRSVHTFDELWFDSKNALFLTTNELGSPYYDPNITDYGTSGTDAGTPWALTTYSSPTGNYYAHWQQPSTSIQTTDFPSAAEDHRQFANYLKIWHSSNLRMMDGNGSSGNGPEGSYDPIQMSVADRASGMHAAMTNTDIAPINCSTTNTSRAPMTVHRAHTFWGETERTPSNTAAWKEAYLAAYSQGVRVLDLSNFIEPGVGFLGTASVNEKAYFDFVPTLNYDINSPFFYSKHYFTGSYDILPDVRQTPTNSDENWVYTWALSDAQSTPFLQASSNEHIGFLILRYFRDQIGGHIHGYSRNTSDANDNASIISDPNTNSKDYEMSFREVNLQGTFAVERPTIIDAGCTVHVLDGSTFNEVATNGIEVDGTLSVETTSEDNRATFNVPIHVVSGGTLIMQSNSHAEFTNLITVDPGG
ncbi:MAG: hypothetical protein ACREBW_07120, partial [Candidatus Micrarchaeaceae archaeon]